MSARHDCCLMSIDASCTAGKNAELSQSKPGIHIRKPFLHDIEAPI